MHEGRPHPLMLSVLSRIKVLSKIGWLSKYFLKSDKAEACGITSYGRNLEVTLKVQVQKVSLYHLRSPDLD